MARSNRSSSNERPVNTGSEKPVQSEIDVAPEPAQEAPDLRRCLSIEQHFRGSSDPLKKAFIHCERLQRDRARKLPAEEWDAEFTRFRTAERR